MVELATMGFMLMVILINVGTVFEYWCNEGYRPTGNPKSVCSQEHFGWDNPSVTCEGKENNIILFYF